jgi:hypothetical protein
MGRRCPLLRKDVMLVRPTRLAAERQGVTH